MKFEEKLEGNNITITAKGKNLGCICTQAIVYFDNIYTFTPTQAGTYTFKFKSSQNADIEKVVIVK